MNRQINEVQMKHTNGLNDRNNKMAAAAAAATAAAEQKNVYENTFHYDWKLNCWYTRQVEIEMKTKWNDTEWNKTKRSEMESTMERTHRPSNGNNV